MQLGFYKEKQELKRKGKWIRRLNIRKWQKEYGGGAQNEESALGEFNIPKAREAGRNSE